MPVTYKILFPIIRVSYRFNYDSLNMFRGIKIRNIAKFQFAIFRNYQILFLTEIDKNFPDQGDSGRLEEARIS